MSEKEFLPAKTCFSHIGGKLGTLLMEQFIEKKWIAKHNEVDKHFYITELGQKEFTKMGINLYEIRSESLF